MKRSPFQALPASPSRERESVSINSVPSGQNPAAIARASWQREVWSTKAAMLSSGLDREKAFALAAKVVGYQFPVIESLSVRQLREIRMFLAEEVNANQG